jgi:hypothetical protein
VFPGSVYQPDRVMFLPADGGVRVRTTGWLRCAVAERS